jgi:hypothetical protein
MAKVQRRITKQIRAELDRLLAEKEDGKITWRDVVRAARRSSSPLHSWFDFSPKRAMEEYLQRQAETLIQNWTIVRTMPDGEKRRFRAVVSLHSDRTSGGGYRSMVAVLSSGEMRRQLVADAMAELAAFQARFKRLKELAEVFEAIARVESRYGKRESERGTSRASRETRANAG